MVGRTHRLIFLVLLLLALPAARAVAADELSYEIKMDRPAKAGDKYHLEALAATRTTSALKVEGKNAPPMDEAVGIRLEGEVEVAAVTDKGREKKLSCTVETCAIKQGKQNLELVPKGTTLTAEWADGKARYRANGKDVPEFASNLLRRVLEISDPEGVGDDDIFGTRERKKVGDAWPLDKDAAVRDFKQKELEVKPEDVDGGTKLLEVAKVDGVPCYKLEVSFEGKNLKGTGKGAAEGMTLEKGSIRGTVTVLLPTDARTGHLKESGTVSVESHLVGKNDDGKQVAVDAKVEELVEKTFGRGK
jgi:hypothetical protein